MEIAKILFGSKLQGLSNENADPDFFVVYLAKPEELLGVFSCCCERAWLEIDKEKQEEAIRIELRTFCKLACQGSPNCIEAICAGAPVETTTIWEELKSMSAAFLSKAVYRPYKRFSIERLYSAIDTELDRRKSLRHSMRAALQGTRLLQTGKLSPALLEEERKLCICIQDVSLGEARSMIERQISLMDKAYKNTVLPDQPDREKIDRWLIQTYIDQWQSSWPSA